MTASARELELAAAVLRLNYKPGWKFRLRRDAVTGLALVVTGAVLHSETLEPITFDLQRLVPECASSGTAVFVSWVRDVLTEVEVHELREFFRFDGKLVDSPHATMPAADDAAESGADGIISVKTAHIAQYVPADGSSWADLSSWGGVTGLADAVAAIAENMRRWDAAGLGNDALEARPRRYRVIFREVRETELPRYDHAAVSAP
jgi:hypothetical protein